ncbi:7159_t:CDS:2, partial [Ambispora leptoticha]
PTIENPRYYRNIDEEDIEIVREQEKYKFQENKVPNTTLMTSMSQNSTTIIPSKQEVENLLSTFLQELIEIDNKSIIIYGKIPRSYNPIYNKKVLNRVTNPPDIKIVQNIQHRHNQLQQIIKTIKLIEIPLLEKERLTLQNAYENNKYLNILKLQKELSELEIIQEGPDRYLYNRRYPSDNSDKTIEAEVRKDAFYYKAKLNTYQRTRSLTPTYDIDWPPHTY